MAALARINAFKRHALVALTLLGLSSLYPAQTGASGLATPAEQNRLLAQLDNRPMVFLVAKGAPDSCGPGCSEWIAAEGMIDHGTAQRFRDFMEALPRKDLPIFFHSRGGYLTEGVHIGTVLRERRMTAGVGRTLPERCRIFDRGDTACQQLIKSGGGVKSRLLANEGQCHSACVYAFLGASIRRVSPGSLLGVHSARKLDNDKKLKKGAAKDAPIDGVMLSRIHDLGKQYLLQLGINPELEDLAGKVSGRRIYILSRDEMVRFGVETRELYQTRWTPDPESAKRFTVRKAVTQRTAAEPAEYLTTTIFLSCDLVGGSSILGYRRELPLNGDRPTSAISLKIGDTNLTFQTRTTERIEVGVASPRGYSAASAFALRNVVATAAAPPDITLTETPPAQASAPSTPHEFKLSTAGLSEAFAELEKRCPPSKPISVPDLWGGRPLTRGGR